MRIGAGVSDSIGRPRRSLGWVIAALLVGAGLLPGCASRSPHYQDFLELRTANFLLTSSLSTEDTIAFGRSLELFHAGVRSLLGLPDEGPAAVPTPVYVFDDRSLGRPFAVQNEAAYLLDEVDAPIIVFRGGRDFAARATPDLRHRYAQRMLRDHARHERPLWYEEGVAQMARTMTETDDGVRLGRIDAEFKHRVLDRRGSELLGALQRFDLSDATLPERERFEAQAWAIAHTLEFSGSPSTGSHTLLDAYSRALDAPGAATRDRAFEAIGLSPEALEKRIYTHLEAPRPKLRQLEFRGAQTSRATPTPISRAESCTRLGELALRLERPELALAEFERALKLEPKHPMARIGRATASAMLGRFEVVDSTFTTVDIRPEAPVEVHVAAGDAYRAVAERTDSPQERRTAVALARQHYQDALRGPTPSARAQLGMALSYLLVEGEDPAQATAWVEAVRKSSSGSLTIELWQARVEARTGAERLAKIGAKNVLSRTHDAGLRKQARALIDSLGGGD